MAGPDRVDGVLAFYGLLAFVAFVAGLRRIADWRAMRRRQRLRDERERYVPKPDTSRRPARPPLKLPDGDFPAVVLPNGGLPGRAFRPAPGSVPEPTALRRGKAPPLRRRAPGPRPEEGGERG